MAPKLWCRLMQGMIATWICFNYYVPFGIAPKGTKRSRAIQWLRLNCPASAQRSVFTCTQHTLCVQFFVLRLSSPLIACYILFVDALGFSGFLCAGIAAL